MALSSRALAALKATRAYDHRLQACVVIVFSMAVVIGVLLHGIDSALNRDALDWGFIAMLTAAGLYHLKGHLDNRIGKPPTT